MLSDEEKKAIVELNHFSNMTAYWKQEEYTNSEIDNYIKIVLNLIEKQSKEIEELKEDNKKKSIVIIEYQDLYEKLEDKIKARIKELEEYLYRGSIKDDFLMIRIKAKIQELQSLLEKE